MFRDASFAEVLLSHDVRSHLGPGFRDLYVFPFGDNRSVGVADDRAAGFKLQRSIGVFCSLSEQSINLHSLTWEQRCGLNGVLQTDRERCRNVQMRDAGERIMRDVSGAPERSPFSSMR